MKQLPLISTALYCQPWCILPASHAELGQLYRSYLAGELPLQPEHLSGSDRVSSGISYDVEPRSGLALIRLDGVIAKRAPDMFCGPQIVDLARLDTLLIDIAQDESIKTLVLDINSPGGCGIGLIETSENIQSVIDSGTRVVAYTDYLMASAAYWLAAACQEIVAAPSAIVGSIGTYVAALDDSRAWEMEGVELKLFRDGAYKAMGHPGKKWTPEEESFMEERLEHWSGSFKGHVRRQRPGVSEETMQGQAFDAASAPEGLIDSLARDVSVLLEREMSLLFE